MKPSNDREAITLILEGLTAVGCEVTGVNDGEEEFTVESVAEAIDHILAVDMATVYLSLPPEADRATSFIWFVLGNEPEKVAADCGVSISPYLDPITDPWWQ